MISSSSTDNEKSKKMQENSKQIKLFKSPKKKKKDLIKSLNSSAQNLINNSRINLCLNTISNLKNNSLPESRKISNKPTFICIKNKNIENDENSNKLKTKKTFLRKKTKNYLNMKTKQKIKPLFITSKTNAKLKSDINNITQDSNFSNKASEKIYLFEKISKKNYNLFETSIEEKKKKGKWTYDENIKFIKAYVNFGKDYGLIEKYIGSRSRIQIISHAQKFFMKLKKLKNNDFDFSDDNIKNLWDIFQLIEAKNKNNIAKEEYIVNTLLTLYESIQNNEDNDLNNINEYNLLNDDIKTRKKNEKKVKRKYSSLNNEKNGKTDNYNKPSKNRKNNKHKKFIFENVEINNNLIKSNLNLNVNEKELYSEGIDIKKGIEIGQNENKQESDIFVDKKSNFSNYVNIDSYFNQNFKFGDDFIFLSSDSNLFFS